MALTGKKYEKFYATTGSGDDKVETEVLTKAEGIWDHYRAKGMDLFLDDFKLSPIIFQLQQMQDELDYLRTEIELNKNKTGITTKQATAITSNSNDIGTKMTVIPNQDYAGIQSVRAGVVLNKDKSYSLVFSYAEVTPKGTTTRTGSIQLK